MICEPPPVTTASSALPRPVGGAVAWWGRLYARVGVPDESHFESQMSTESVGCASVLLRCTKIAGKVFPGFPFTMTLFILPGRLPANVSALPVYSYTFKPAELSAEKRYALPFTLAR